MEFFILASSVNFLFDCALMLCRCNAHVEQVYESSLKKYEMRFTWRKQRHGGFRVYRDLADSVEGRYFSIQ